MKPPERKGVRELKDWPRRASMLVLSRKANQSIMIGSDIRIIVVGVDRDQVKLGIEAPKDVPVHRLEVYAGIHGVAEKE
jgi:carbon storage regulator